MNKWYDTTTETEPVTLSGGRSVDGRGFPTRYSAVRLLPSATRLEKILSIVLRLHRVVRLPHSALHSATRLHHESACRGRLHRVARSQRSP